MLFAKDDYRLGEAGHGSYSGEYHNTYYWHTDHLGSAQLITDWQGNEYRRIEYTPYGETWIEKAESTEYIDGALPYRFTGKELDEETGLYYYGARYLDPKYSVWTSADPALGDYLPAAGADISNLPGMGGVFNIVNLNLYHYAANNPIKYTDPDGRELYVNGSKQYMAAVQRELENLCSGVIINYDTGEVSLSSYSKTANPQGYELLSSLINSPKMNIIWLGNSRIKDGNSTYPYDTRISLINGKFDTDFDILDNNYGTMNSVINFDPDNWEGGYDDNGSTNRPPFVGLAHESGHSEAMNNGTQTYERYSKIPGTTPAKERNSIEWENKIRGEHSLTLRSYYYQPISVGE